MSAAPPAPQDSPGRAPLHVWDYWRILWEGRRLMGVVLIATTSVALVGTLLLPNRYRAECLLELNLAPPVLLGTETERSNRMGFFEQEHQFKTEFVKIKTRDMLRTAMEQHRLGEKVPGLGRAKDPVRILQRALEVDKLAQTNVASLQVSWGDPESAAVIANAVAQTYVDSDLAERIRQLQERAGKLGASAKESSQARAQAIAHDLRTLATAKDIETIMALDSIKENENLPKLREKLVGIEAEVANLLGTYGRQYEGVVAKENEKQDVLRQVEQEVAAVRSALESEYRSLGGDPAAVETSDTVAYVGAGEQDSSRNLEDLLRKRYNEQQVTAQLAEPKARVIERALPPEKPFAPKLWLNLLLAVVAGAGFGGGLVFFRDYLDSGVKTLDDVERYVGLSTLAVVPRFQGEPDAVARESFQTLRTGLLFASSGRRDRVVLVTSSAPGEGKTTVTAGLARSIAASGESVVVVDCDLRRPSVGRAFGLRGGKGLSNFLADASERDWKPYLVQVEPKLSVLLTGPVPPNPLSLLGQARLAELVRELKDAHDWVILDSPPVSSVSDSLLLSSLAELVVLTLRHDSTDKEVARRTLQRLRGVSARVVGAVLTDVDMEKAYNRDYYYGRFYYGHYYGGAEVAEPPPQGWKGKLEKASRQILKG